MFQRINQKIYGIAGLFILLSLLTYGGVAVFLDHQTSAAEKEQSTLIAAGNFFSLRQMFFQLRTLDRTVLPKGNPDAESRFVQIMRDLKERLALHAEEAGQLQKKTQLEAVIASVGRYDANFSLLSQLLTRHQLLETDIETIYQSIEAAALSRGDFLLLRKVFLLNRFQTGYFKAGRSSSFQALKIVHESMSQAFREVDFFDDRIKDYFANYANSLESFESLNRNIEETSNKLEINYLSSIKLFEQLSKDLEFESKEAITAANKRRSQLKNAMYVYLPLTSLLMFVILLLLARKIITPISTLLEIINQVKSGDNKKRFIPRGDAGDELNQLGEAFNGMLDTLDAKQESVLEYQTELTEKIAELGELNENLQVEISERVRVFGEKSILEEQLRQSQKMEAIGTLAGGIAHDFNNILAAIIGYTELTRRKLADGAKEKRNLGEVIKAADRAKQLIQQILMFSRKNEVQRESVHIDELVEEALSLLRQTIPATTPIHAEISSKIGVIHADVTQMHQIVMNLCTNAYHAVRDRGGEIFVRLEPVLVDHQLSKKWPDISPGSYAQLIIKDTGTGISPKVVPRIFDPFFTTKEQGEGTGMGLAVVYGIIRNHDGAIIVETEVGVGTTFRVFFPLSTTEETNKLTVDEPLKRGDERVLFIDDERSLAELGQLTLESLGYRAFATTSVDEALEIFRKNPHGYDLIISDQSMPEMSGADFTQAVLAIRPEIPVILSTGYSDVMNSTKAKELGARALLLKPIEIKALASMLREILDNSPAEVNLPTP